MLGSESRCRGSTAILFADSLCLRRAKNGHKLKVSATRCRSSRQCGAGDENSRIIAELDPNDLCRTVNFKAKTLNMHNLDSPLFLVNYELHSQMLPAKYRSAARDNKIQTFFCPISTPQTGDNRQNIEVF
jgi:hypothetical protein